MGDLEPYEFCVGGCADGIATACGPCAREHRWVSRLRAAEDRVWELEANIRVGTNLALLDEIAALRARVAELEGEVVAAKKVGRTEGEEAGREEALEAAAVLAETGGTRAGEMLARRIREYRRAALDAAKGET